jgi:DNA mismatch repair protein MutS2
VVVQAGALRTRVRRDAVVVTRSASEREVRAGQTPLGKRSEPREEPRDPFRKSRDEREAQAEALRGGAVRVAHDHLDLRGQRVEEALEAAERFLDDSLHQGREQVVLVHGHGTGALKSAVRRALKDSPYVEKFRPGSDLEGGQGVTVVVLR